MTNVIVKNEMTNLQRCLAAVVDHINRFDTCGGCSIGMPVPGIGRSGNSDDRSRATGQVIMDVQAASRD
jgi:hypothetical protein